MAGPGGREAGRVTVRVVPDTSKFPAELRRELAALDDDLKVDVGLDTKRLSAEFAAMKRRIESDTIHAKVDVDRKRFGGIAESLTGIGGAAGDALGALKNIGAGATSAGATLAGLALNASTVALQFTALAGVVMAAGGAVGAALGAVPALVAGVAAPLAAVVIGFDGISKAAGSLKPQMDALSASLNSTFASGLAPVFERLGAVFPVLKAGLTGVAEGVIRMADGFARMLTSSQGMMYLRDAFAGIQVLIDTISPKLGYLMAVFLQIAGMSGLYRILGETIAGVANQFAFFLDSISTFGLLGRSLAVVRDILISAAGAFTQFVEAGMNFLVGAGPGITQLFDGIAQAIGRIDWVSLGESMGAVFAKIGQWAAQIDPAMFERVAQSFIRLGESIGAFVASGGLDLLVAGFTVLVDMATGVVTAITWIGEKLGLLSGQTAETAASVGSSMGSMQGSTATAFAGMGAAAASGSSNVQGQAQGMASRVPSILNAGWNIMISIARAAFGGGLSGAIGGGIAGAVALVTTVPGRVKGGLGNLGGLLVASGRALMQGFARGISSAIGAAVSAARNAVSAVRAFFPFSPAKEGPFSGHGYTTYSGRALAEDWASGIRAGTSTAVAAVNSMMSEANQAASAEWRGHISSDSFGGISGSVQDGVLAAFNGSRLQVDGNGLAKIVNNVNNRNARR